MIVMMKKAGAVMAIDVEFYTCNDDPRTLVKTMSPVLENVIPATLTANTSILQPTLLIKYNGAVRGANYMHIPHFNRWYTIENITVTEGERMTVTGMCDPVHTVKDQILNCPCVCIRKTAQYPTDVPDTQLPVNPVKGYVTSVFLGGTNDFAPVISPADEYYILTVKGGGL